MKMSNKVYDILKKVVTIYLPALGTFVLTVSLIWGLPYGEAIGATLEALALLIGTCIGISSAKYNKEQEDELKDELNELNELEDEETEKEEESDNE